MTTLMFAEAAEAGAAVERMLTANQRRIEELGRELASSPPSAIVVCARGSSDHAGVYGKYLFETLCGTPVAAAALSVASVYGAAPRMARDRSILCIAISQSGRSPDLLASARAWQDRGARLVAFVNDETSPLAGMADVFIPLSAGPERSVAATKSFIVALAAEAALAAAWSGNQDISAALIKLPDQLRAAHEIDWSNALPVLNRDQSLFVLGRGYGLSVAREAALKLKETCSLHAEAFSSAEVRHGPMAIVKKGFPILAFAGSDASGADVLNAAASFAARGAAVAVISPRGTTVGPDIINLSCECAHPTVEPVLQIQSFYRLVEQLARLRGLDPDNPAFLSKVTQTI
ncbi:MAG TPA: SIS domain-containing protein [Hyphomonadaceae bacterium]|nr:SIS domain-containing protein [Hyphomonadaceae bacterium]HPN05024.1 SIS domain-containing protein [Hyphomonadaceae bacterium]